MQSKRSGIMLLILRMCVSRSVMSNFLQPYELLPTRLLHPRDFPDKNTGMGCHLLLQILRVNSFFKIDDFYISQLNNISQMQLYIILKIMNFNSKDNIWEKGSE